MNQQDHDKQAEAEKKLRDVAALIAELCPANVGFALCMFSFGEDGWFTFASNCNREDMINLLDEWKEKISTP